MVKGDCEEEKEEEEEGEEEKEEEVLMLEELRPGNRTASFDLWPLVKLIVAIIMMTMHSTAQTILDGLGAR